MEKEEERIMFDLFGGLFDFNDDGHIDTFERGVEIAIVTSVLDDSQDSENEDEMTELELSGLDPEELEFMDEDERREVLEDAGLDPDEFDF